MVKITSVGRWSVFGEVIDILNQVNHKAASNHKISNQNNLWSPCSSPDETCACSNEQQLCACGPESSDAKTTTIEKLPSNTSSRNLIGWLLRKRKSHVQRNVEANVATGSKEKQERINKSDDKWDAIDKVLLGGIVVSFFTIVTLLIHFGYRTAV